MKSALERNRAQPVGVITMNDEAVRPKRDCGRLRCRARRPHAREDLFTARPKAGEGENQTQPRSISDEPDRTGPSACRAYGGNVRRKQGECRRHPGPEALATAGYVPLAAPRASSASLVTVFQLRAVLATSMPLSNFSASLEVPKPFGVYR